MTNDLLLINYSKALDTIEKIKDALPKREWVGLTDEERNVINRHNIYVSDIIKATEAKLKEKNT